MGSIILGHQQTTLLCLWNWSLNHVFINILLTNSFSVNNIILEPNYKVRQLFIHSVSFILCYQQFYSLIIIIYVKPSLKSKDGRFGFIISENTLESFLQLINNNEKSETQQECKLRNQVVAPGHILHSSCCMSVTTHSKTMLTAF